MTYKILLSLTLLVTISSISFAQKDPSNALMRKWEMISMQIEGSTISEEMLDRQKRSSLKTVLHFRSGGVCYMYIFTPKGRILRKNRWQLSNNHQSLVIQPEEGPAQSFEIVKISSKKMTLALSDGREKQLFSYKAVKD